MAIAISYLKSKTPLLLSLPKSLELRLYISRHLGAHTTSSGTANTIANTMMQKFWDSALALEPPDDCDTQSELSALMASDGTDGKFPYPSLGLGNSFAFKFEDLRGRMHRINCGMENLDELLSAVMQRIGAANDHVRPHILFEDDEGDRVLLATDDDLVSAVSHARGVGLKNHIAVRYNCPENGMDISPHWSFGKCCCFNLHWGVGPLKAH